MDPGAIIPPNLVSGRYPPLGQEFLDGPELLTLRDLERPHVPRLFERVRWRVAGRGGAAETLCLKSATLRSKMKKLGIKHSWTEC